MLNEKKKLFWEEALEHLSIIESSLIELEQNNSDLELISSIYRSMHTIKGNSSIMGYDKVAEFVHEIESLYSLLREEKIQATHEIINLSLLATDHIRIILNSCLHDDEDCESEKTQDFIQAFQNLTQVKNTGFEVKETIFSEEIKEENTKYITYRIQFRPAQDFFISGGDFQSLIEELSLLGDYTLLTNIENIPDLSQYNPDICYIAWDIILTTNHDLNAVKDLFIFYEDTSEIKIKKIEEITGDKKLGEILIEREDISPNELQSVIEQQQQPLGLLLKNAGIVKQNQIQAALLEQEHLRNFVTEKKPNQSISSIRVPSEKLDLMIDQIGELIASGARLYQIASERNDSDLLLISDEIKQISNNLHDISHRARMITIGESATRLKRLVRDLSYEQAKKVNLITLGMDTEIDKNVLDQLNDPFMHIIRNAIDHGIESPEERIKQGKPEESKLVFSASYQNNHISIEIQDDGKGISVEKVRQKALEKGLISPDQQMLDQDLLNLVFLAGLSTSEKVTTVSGRGVGMDVVKKTIQSLRGKISLSSVEGKGTKIQLEIPLMLAIIEGLLVQIDHELFVIPLESVEECIEIQSNQHHQNKADQFNLRGKLTPFINLRKYLNFTTDPPPIEQIVVAEINHQKVGFLVDYVVGKHQTAIKNMGKLFQSNQGVSGATIMGDGRVGLVLNLETLIQGVL
ncbi:MAG: two-component system chemotaxis sensor kinase CheA [bacterium]|jgi:two-component system chemotaxis sensor kinase CheA